MAWSRWRERLKFWQLAAALALLTALIALGVSMVLKSLYVQDRGWYEPKDLPRGELIEKK
ncbi:MAG: hypothetical protein E6K63_08970 [Nitrospirae bacterium]|nr:MAG: hypothetical protein E6K63_08970 [Nitrospirota bacterium]